MSAPVVDPTDGYPMDEVLDALEGTPTPPPPSEPIARLSPAWPVLHQDAYCGLAGDLVCRLEPETESDPVALLAQLLAGVGSACGRGPHVRVENTRHGLNEFLAIVAATGRGRKGTSWNWVAGMLDGADPLWAKRRVGGLSSGEGLIWSVRDPLYKQAPVREGKSIVRYETQLEDAGVEDKRLLVYEPELGGVLRTMKRESNTLSAILRQAWDGSDLRVLTKASPATATDPHVSVVGHITAEELRGELAHVDLMNGLVNRFLLVCARRSKELPNGGNVDPQFLDVASRDLALAIEHGRRVGELRRNAAAEAAWPEMYSALTADRPGILGAITARAEAHVVRLSALYAVLNRASAVELHHLMAAYAFWSYCEDSARYLFGETTGNSVADVIYRAISASPSGLTRTEIQALFQNNQTKPVLDRALDLLTRAGLARPESSGSGRGRPAERWVRSSISSNSYSGRNERGHIVPMSSNERNERNTVCIQGRGNSSVTTVHERNEIDEETLPWGDGPPSEFEPEEAGYLRAVEADERATRGG